MRKDILHNRRAFDKQSFTVSNFNKSLLKKYLSDKNDDDCNESFNTTCFII